MTLLVIGDQHRIDHGRRVGTARGYHIETGTILLRPERVVQRQQQPVLIEGPQCSARNVGDIMLWRSGQNRGALNAGVHARLVNYLDTCFGFERFGKCLALGRSHAATAVVHDDGTAST
ncbi:hypothetical protein [Bradyrhizobium sp. SSUT77]|uniref:hypothetical protein n=1 Tax=Bradyrhizobium sp. SSUT77 TaxID=3040603 RepID=UPI00244A64F9|nr:hypothetical protein [Bradyrhizobium sp. SSUT77]MDH2344073.1 hypothetical protein [Bradyrhizobium sp. SSUT77]